jgi:hypothetical protein
MPDTCWTVVLASLSVMGEPVDYGIFTFNSQANDHRL